MWRPNERPWGSFVLYYRPPHAVDELMDPRVRETVLRLLTSFQQSYSDRVQRLALCCPGEPPIEVLGTVSVAPRPLKPIDDSLVWNQCLDYASKGRSLFIRTPGLTLVLIPLQGDRHLIIGFPVGTTLGVIEVSGRKLGNELEKILALD